MKTWKLVSGILSIVAFSSWWHSNHVPQALETQWLKMEKQVVQLA